MKTQLILLETHDDAISIRDKMSWAKTPRILLVWPRKGRVDVRPFDLTLLRRHALALGAELGLVTRDSEIRAAARRMDLPVFSKASQAQRKTWPLRATVHPKRPALDADSPRLDLRAVRAALPDPDPFAGWSAAARLVVFSLGVLAVLLIPLFFMPSAEIRLDAPTRPQSVKIDVSAEPDAAQVSLAGVIPSRLLTFDVEMNDSMRASGETVAPNQAAEGTVRFTNLGAAAVDVPVGTVVLTLSDPPARFATLEATQVPLGNGSIAYARVRALALGSAGNVPVAAVTAFEGPLGLSLGVINLSPMRGGADLAMAAPTDADRQTLHNRLLAAIQTQAKSRLAAQLKNGDVVFASSFGFSKVLDETYKPAPGEPGGKLTLTMRAEFHAHYAAAADLEQLAARALDASLPVGYEPAAGSLQVSAASPLFGGADGLARW
ncbi:MAG: baseplate J/gp47 family protein, partial [Anaerolineales bacterium]